MSALAVSAAWKWARDMAGILHVPWHIPMKLSDMFIAIVPQHKELLKNHHSAGCDSCMHWLLCREVVRLLSTAASSN